MELIVNREPPPNLHPIWYRHFGFQPQSTRPATQTKTVGLAATAARPAALRPRSAQENDGWEPTCGYQPHPGAPVGIRRRLGRSTWESTVVLPGDSRYPWPDRATDSTH